MGLMDDAKKAINDAENTFHEEKGKVEGYVKAKQDEAEKKCDCGKDGYTCEKDNCDC